MPETITIARGIVFNDGKILVLQNADDDEQEYARGKWEFPGGYIEDSDAGPQDTVIREVSEETGLETTVVEQLPRVAVTEDKRTVAATYFLLEATNRDVTLSNEHQAYRWIVPDKFVELDWLTYAGYTLPILRDLKGRI